MATLRSFLSYARCNRRHATWLSARQYPLGRPGNLLEVVEVRFALCAEVKRAIEIEVALKRLSFPLGLAT
jgi:hypothetical protein